MSVTNNGKVIIFGAAADAVTDHIIIDHIRWVKPSTAAHDLKLTDTADKEFLAAAVDVDKNDQEIPMYGLSVLGIKVATMGSGTLYVYPRLGK